MGSFDDLEQSAEMNQAGIILSEILAGNSDLAAEAIWELRERNLKMQDGPPGATLTKITAALDDAARNVGDTATAERIQRFLKML